MKVILIDEDTQAMNHLMYQLNQVCSIEVVGVYTDLMVGKEALKTIDVDLVIIAIYMSDTDEIAIIEEIKQSQANLSIVLLANDNKHAVKAFEMNVFDYLVKPVESHRLGLTMERLMKINTFKKVPKNKGQLQLNLFGELFIVEETINKSESLYLDWRTKKAEQLFLFLVTHESRIIAKSEMIEKLWQGVDMDRAYGQLYVTISYMRKTLKPVKQYIQVKSKLDCYEVKLDNVKIDTNQFDEIYLNNSHLSADNLAKYETALKINDNALLKNYDYKWLAVPRRKYDVKWLHIACRVLDYYEEKKAYDRLGILTNLACERFSLEEIGYFYLMKYHEQDGGYFVVEKVCQDLTNMDSGRLHTYPNNHIVERYRQLKEYNVD